MAIVSIALVVVGVVIVLMGAIAVRNGKVTYSDIMDELEAERSQSDQKE